MALLRSEILNKDFIEKVIRQFEGTSKVGVTALRVGKADQKGSLLEERLAVWVEATVKGRTKEYDWIAKVLRPEAGPANYARFQGILETEISFYVDYVLELGQIGAPLPRTFGVLWGDFKTLNREILLLEQPSSKGFKSAIPLQKNGLDLGHVILVAEWLAKFHALSYVLMRKHAEAGKGDRNEWLKLHPWIRKSNEECLHMIQMPEGTDEKDLSGSGMRKRLMTMVATCLKTEASGEHKKIENLLERQDWLDNLRKETMAKPTKMETDFMTVCHGEPWLGSIYFKYADEQEPVEKTEENEGHLPCPIDVTLADFQACSIGRPGIDLAHFLLTSTTREFRKNHLETILQIYLTELEDVVISQGYAPGFYSPADLRSDYRRGLIMGITFCLFAMPMLSADHLDEVDAYDQDLPEGAQLDFQNDVRDRLIDGLADAIDMLEED